MQPSDTGSAGPRHGMGATTLGAWSIELPSRELVWSAEMRAIHDLDATRRTPDLEQAVRFLAPGHREAFVRAIEHCIDRGTPLALEADIVSASGANKHIRIMGEAVSLGGRAVRIQGACLETIGLRAAEDRRERAEALLRKAGSVALVGGWAIDAPSREVHWSDEVFGILEFPEDARPTLADGLELYPLPDREQVRTAIDACARFGTPFDLEVRVHTARGRQIWVRLCGEAEAGPEGAPRRVSGAIQDISRQKADSAAIAGLLDRVRATLESITDAFFTLDGQWRFTYVNAQAERLLQRSREELLGRNVWQEFREAVGTSFQIHYERALETGQTETFEEYYPPLARWFMVKAYPSRDGLAIYFHDVTELWTTREAARASEERFRLLAQATSDAIWDWDLRSDVLWWNDEFESLVGTRTEAAVPAIHAWSGRLHPEDKDRVLGEMQQAMQSGVERWTASYRLCRPDGAAVHIEHRGRLVRDAFGAVTRIVGGMTDVSRRHALEDQLRQAQRLEAVGRLTGGVAHDFNNLLTVMLGNAESLSEQLVADASARMLADMIASAAQRGAELTKRLLAFARKQPLRPSVVDVNHLVTGLDGMLRRTLGEHIEIELVRGAGLWHAVVDPGELDNALLNVVFNARDAMPRGGRLTIETANTHLDQQYADARIEVQPGQYVMLAVSDTGTGITPEVLQRAFEPFFTTKDPGQGTGLGLAMVYGFVKQSSGHVAIYSEPGQGTTVKIYLPRSHSRAGAPDPAGAPLADAGGDETVLLVEDDAMVRQFARQQLVSLGYAVLEAADGNEAMAIVRARTDIDLLFTDVVMPGGMSGRVLADEARALRPAIKMLFTSGYTENAIVHHGRLDPGVHLLSKPYRKRELARKLREVLGK